MPSLVQLARYFPDIALRSGVSGTATVDCTVGVNGDLLGCWVDTENPGNMGFGAAALELSTVVQMQPAGLDGFPTAGRSYDLQAVFTVDPAARLAQVTLFTGF
jgi:protein TonB